MTAEVEIPTIPEFFKGRDIFVTGGSGFMGKVLIEKLLRSCSDLNTIFVLIREKKSKSTNERLDVLLKVPLFDRLRTENPEVLKKLIAVNGDVTALQLGLSPVDLDRMSNVSVIFHAAASVRFDDPLKEAILMNTRGTHQVLLFAETLKQIKIIVHVSTTYCNCDHKIVHEQVYPPKADWRVAIKIAENFDAEVINALTPKFSGYAPNTYTFTKQLAEQVVYDYRDRLPIIIYRPSIVISALDEPIPGWIDSFNGPAGMMTACGLGIYRTAYGDPEVVSDFTPVDVSIKAMIIGAWKKGVETQPETNNDVKVYNCSTSIQRKFTTGFIVKMGEVLTAAVPLDKMLWRPGGYITKCKYFNYIKVILLHILPALLVDSLLRITGKPPFLTKLQRRIYGANCALHYFMSTHWEFKNDHFLELSICIKDEDQRDFQFDSFITADILSYLTDCIYGARRFLLHEKDENLPKARQKYRRMAILDRTVMAFIRVGLVYVVLIKFGLLYFILGY